MKRHQQTSARIQKNQFRLPLLEVISPRLIFHAGEDVGHILISTSFQDRNFLVKIDIHEMKFRFQCIIVVSNSNFSNLITATEPSTRCSFTDVI